MARLDCDIAMKPRQVEAEPELTCASRVATREQLAASIAHAVNRPITLGFAAIGGDSPNPTNSGGVDVTDSSCYFGRHARKDRRHAHIRPH
jgi:hypothetical protein